MSRESNKGLRETELKQLNQYKWTREVYERERWRNSVDYAGGQIQLHQWENDRYCRIEKDIKAMRAVGGKSPISAMDILHEHNFQWRFENHWGDCQSIGLGDNDGRIIFT